ncbi:MAG: bifunctional diguanylate cyclase/phosphodiesterase [Pseudomonadota bacterium]
MNVRKRLVTAFVLVALFVLVLFGLVAHRAALDANNVQELVLLEQVVTTEVKTHLTALPKTISLEQIRGLLPHSESPEFVFFATDHKNIIMNQRGSQAVLDELTATFPLKEVLDSPSHNGNITTEQYAFSWAKSALPALPYTLVLIHRKDPELPTFSVTLAKRLAILAFVITWLAIWIALIASKRIVATIDGQNAALHHQALHDKLTDLPNRYHFTSELDALIAGKRALTLFIIDLNNLRDINDTLGHTAGDQMLRLASQRILALLPAGAIASRFGGDEFAVTVHIGSDDEIAQLATRLNQAINQAYAINGLEIMTHASIGAALYPNDAEDAATLIKRAETAMYHAKQQRLAFQQYDSEIDPYSVQRLALMAEMRHAIEDNQLVAFYQPKIDLQTLKTTSVETLVRWKHPTRGMIPPNDFIYLAEKSDLIGKLTLWVLEESLRQCRRWQDQGIHISVAVNLSARNLYDQHLAEQVDRLLKKWAIPAEQLKLEITESVIMADPEAALATLNRLHAMGIKLSVDDFGTGYSSLSYLKRLPVSEIKIDRSFIMDMLKNESDSVIVKSTIDLAHNMGCIVVAEGIEDEPTLHHLIKLGCDMAQGYFISRPVAGADLTPWLSDSRWAA